MKKIKNIKNECFIIKINSKSVSFEINILNMQRSFVPVIDIIVTFQMKSANRYCLQNRMTHPGLAGTSVSE